MRGGLGRLKAANLRLDVCGARRKQALEWTESQRKGRQVRKVPQREPWRTFALFAPLALVAWGGVSIGPWRMS